MVAPSGRGPTILAPMKGALRAMKPRVEGLISKSIKSDETRTPLFALIYPLSLKERPSPGRASFPALT